MWGMISSQLCQGKIHADAVWDNASAIIDPQTHEIKKLVTHITLIQLPFMTAVADRIEAAGGYLLTNVIASPRSLWNKKIIASNETSGSDQQSVGSDTFRGRSRRWATGYSSKIRRISPRHHHKLNLGAAYFCYGGTLDYDLPF